jgi:hypothetical protein
VILLEDESQTLRLENFKATNGPDLYIYLATDNSASDFVNLGKLKASSGNQNYEIPEDTDLSKYDKVLVWCKAFSVLFGHAQISPNSSVVVSDDDADTSDNKIKAMIEQKENMMVMDKEMMKMDKEMMKMEEEKQEMKKMMRGDVEVIIDEKEHAMLMEKELMMKEKEKFMSKVTSTNKINHGNANSPTQQMVSGIEPYEVTCKSDLDLMKRISDDSAMCVKPSSANTLMERGIVQYF